MKRKMISALLLLTLALFVGTAFAEGANWAFGALPLNSEDAGVGTIFYARDYFALENIVNPVTAAAYTVDEIDAIVGAAAEGAEGYRFDLPAGALLGMSVYGDDTTVFWFDAENAAAIVSHADPLVMDAETGAMSDANGAAVASAMTK